MATDTNLLSDELGLWLYKMGEEVTGKTPAKGLYHEYTRTSLFSPVYRISDWLRLELFLKKFDISILFKTAWLDGTNIAYFSEYA